jgi:hypothetical protein
MESKQQAILLGFALALGGCATDPPLVATMPDGSPIYGRSFTPTPRDAAVTVSCAVGDDQRLTDCRIISEQPEGSGFGAAALTAATGQKVSTRNGRPVEGRIQATMRFRKD